ncbi:hypothetical protein JYT61_00090 [bacterium AH-315-E10]|nr:hypothetical protein [bacterium AH-315-E10]
MSTSKKSRYDFATAQSLYKKNIHPRVVLGAKDLDKIRKQVTSGDAKKIMAGLRRRVFPLYDAVHESDNLPVLLTGDGSWNSFGARIYLAIDDMAMVAAIDRDERSMQAMHLIMDSLSNADKLSSRAGMGLMSLGMTFDLLYHSYSAKQKRLYVKRVMVDIREAIDSMKDGYFKSSGSNILFVRTAAVLDTVLAIKGEPGTASLKKDLDHLILCIDASLHTTTGPDGYPEEDTGYGVAVSARLVEAGEWLRRAGLYDLYERCPRIKNFGQAVLHILEPWGTHISNTGDHGADFGHREFVLARLATETKDPTLLWLLGSLSYHHGNVHPENTMPFYWIEVHLRKGFQVPATHSSLLVLDELSGAKSPTSQKTETAFYDRGRGVVSFRNGWKPLDSFVFFDGSQRSPSTQGHFHASCGHFSLSAVGEYFSIGTGRYCNDQDQHSLVLINGKSGRSVNGEWTQCCYHGRLTDYQPDSLCDYSAVDSSHQHEAMWAYRHLGFVKGPEFGYTWIVDDINNENKWDEYWWQMQSSPENKIQITKKGATISGWRHGNKLDVHFVLPHSTYFPKKHTLKVSQDIQSAGSLNYLNKNPATSERGQITSMKHHVERFARPADMVLGPSYLRPRLLAKVAGYNARFLSLMLPRLKSQRPCKVTQPNCLPNSLAVKIHFKDVVDTIIFAFEHNLLEADGIVGRGRFCVVRRNRKTGRVVAKSLGYGSELRVDGKRLI